jgi:branched-subunit amino acid ABC-type transport system permease component
VALAVVFLGGRPRAGALLAAGVALGVVESLATVLVGGAWREIVASGCVLLWLLLPGRTVLADA